MNPFSGSGKGGGAVDGTAVLAVAFGVVVAVIDWPSTRGSRFKGASREFARGGVDATEQPAGACLLLSWPSMAAALVAPC